MCAVIQAVDRTDFEDGFFDEGPYSTGYLCNNSQKSNFTTRFLKGQAKVENPAKYVLGNCHIRFRVLVQIFAEKLLG